MKQKHLLKSFFLLLAMMVGSSVWAQTDKSVDYLGNVTLGTEEGVNASICTIVIDNTEYDGIKAGTSKSAGAVKISVPKNTKYLHLHLAGWKGESVTLTAVPNGYFEKINLTSNDGISNNSPFTFVGDASTTDYYKVITFSSALTAKTDFIFTATSGKRFVVWGVTAEKESTEPDPSVATTVTIDATGIINTDVYKGTAAGTLTATVKAGDTAISSANVIWESENEEVATIDADGVVTLVAAGTTTITASYAGETDVYKPSSNTYELIVTDSTPFDGAIFDAINDMGISPIVKDNVSLACTNGVLNNGSEYRFYKNSTTTISTTDGSAITKIEFTCTSGNPASGFGSQTGWTTSGYNGIWSGEAESVSFEASGAQVRATVIKVTVSPNSNPSIIADDVNIAYDATSGSIVYTINNPISGGVLSATTSADWLTLGTVCETVPFTCEANSTAAIRTASVTLTYSYGDTETATKELTVSQAGNPDAFDKISDIVEVNEAYSVRGTVVATNSKGFVIGDGTGYVYTYLNAAPTVAVNNMVTVSGTTGTYGQIIQFTNSATVAEATSSSYDNTPAATVITAVPDYTSGYHLSTYLEFEGILAKSSNNYFITLGESQIQISYPTTAQGTALTTFDGKTVHVKGYFSGINSSGKFTVMLESIEEVVSTDPVINASNVTLAYDATSGEIAYTITNPSDATLTATSNDEWISNITVETDKVTFTTTANESEADRTATITLSYTGATAVDVTVTQKHFVKDYADLPFLWAGDTSTPVGVTNSGVGTYNSSPYLKFDGTGDFLVLKINERPGILTFDIKGNSFSGGTFTVQTSEDGVTYTDLETYTTLGDKQSEEFDNLAETVRYIKWIYSEKSSGNVALGNISLAKYVLVPTITVSTNTINASADETQGTIAVTYNNVNTSVGIDFEWYTDATCATTTTAPDWITLLFDTSHNLRYTIEENTGEARTAYLKVWGYSDPTTTVYSDLITFTQAAPIPPATLPFSWDGGASADFLALDGVTASGLGSDYAESNAPYLVKLDGTGDYIQVKTDGQIYKVTLEVKMLGGANTSTITVQGSADGKTFTDVQELQIMGAQNTVLYLETTNSFDANYRFVRMLFTKGSNVGVGAVTINYVRKAITAAGYATYCLNNALDYTNVQGLKAYRATVANKQVSFTEVTEVPAGEGVLLKGDEGTYKIPVVATAATIENAFVGVTEVTYVNDPGIFVLMSGDSGVGFYKTSTSFTLSANTAYLPATVGDNARSFIGFDFDGGTTTAIDQVEDGGLKMEDSVYNLQGQRVVKAQKGLYIVNGRLQVVK